VHTISPRGNPAVAEDELEGVASGELGRAPAQPSIGAEGDGEAAAQRRQRAEGVEPPA
jgi:hypothetical protein